VSLAKAVRASLLHFGSAVQRQVLVKALSEFATLWLDEFEQKYLSADAVQILCALATAARHVPPKTPKRLVYRKWKNEVETLLEHVGITDHRERKWHAAPEEILEVTQRLAKLGSKDSVRLVEAVQEVLRFEKRRRPLPAKAPKPEDAKDELPSDSRGLEHNRPEEPVCFDSVLVPQDAELQSLAVPTLKEACYPATRPYGMACSLATLVQGATTEAPEDIVPLPKVEVREQALRVPVEYMTFLRGK
ncbi:SVEP1, partial [Symbiodinium pilosum]